MMCQTELTSHLLVEEYGLSNKPLKPEETQGKLSKGKVEAELQDIIIYS